MEFGFVAIECRNFSFGLDKQLPKEPQVRVDLEFSSDKLKWEGSGSVKASSVPCISCLQDSANIVYVAGFGDYTAKSTLFDLNDGNLNNLINSSVSVKVISIGEVAAEPAAPAKGGKGAPAAPTGPVETCLVEITVPMSVLLFPGCSMEISDNLTATEQSTGMKMVQHPSVKGDLSALNLKIYGDNDFAGYVLGCRLIQWGAITLANPSPAWILHAADVIDPKAKVQPTAADLAAKYVENVSKLVDNQEKVCSYTVSIGSEGGEVSELASYFQFMVMKAYKLTFDKEAASKVPVEGDVRSRGDLWSISWSGSPLIFLHRNTARKLVRLIQSDPSAAYLPVTVKKLPAPEYLAAEGGELFATALLDVSGIVQEKMTRLKIEAVLQSDSMAQTNPSVPAHKFTVACNLNSPLVTKSSVPQRPSAEDSAEGFSPASFLPQEIFSGKEASGTPNRDAVQEMRLEISRTIERIAQEYVSLFPNAAEASSPGRVSPMSETTARNNNSATSPMALEMKKADFLNFLMSNGIFHELKESLKPRIQLIIQERYGTRGRALGRSQLMSGFDTQQFGEGEDVSVSVEALLSELYVYLSKECNLVLNSMFTDTIVGRDKAEVNSSALINDEVETELQTFDRLLRQAVDAAADLRFETAEEYHRERLQLINNSVQLGSNANHVHAAFARYGEFLLAQCANVRVNHRQYGGVNSAAREAQATGLLHRAREALHIAVEADPSKWRISLLYCGLLIELQQLEQAEVLLLGVINMKLAEAAEGRGLGSFQELDDYETDKLSPVASLCYTTLAALFSLQGHALKCRKALILAKRNFQEDLYSPPISQHGKPQRTIVLQLSQAAVHFFSYSLNSLGQECVKLAEGSEVAVTSKASSRGMASVTVPHIRHYLKLAECMGLQCVPDTTSGYSTMEQSQQALERALECQLIADIAIDKTVGWLAVAKAELQCAGSDPSKAIDAFLFALEEVQMVSPLIVQEEKLLPLEAILTLAKLLMSVSRYEDALNVLVTGCNYYCTASIFLLIGICSFRLNQLQDAEDALVEANLLENRNPEIWAYLCLVCISSGLHRIPEADQALFQALRLDLASKSNNGAGLLRELATAYMSVDKLQTAEDLIRRAIHCELRNASDEEGYTKRANPYTRRLLADVLAGQNNAVKAVEEYQQVLIDDAIEPDAKMEVAQKCADLLASLGRDEELAALQSVIETLGGGSYTQQ